MFKVGDPRPPNSGTRAGNKARLSKMREFCAKQCQAAGAPYSTLVEMLIWIAINGKDPLENRMNEELGEKSPFHPSKVNWQDGEGKIHRVGGFIPLETRVDCAKLALPFMHNKLHAIEITGEDGGPVRTEETSVAAQLSRDPDIRRMFEKVAQKAAGLKSLEEESPEPEPEQIEG